MSQVVPAQATVQCWRYTDGVRERTVAEDMAAGGCRCARSGRPPNGDGQSRIPRSFPDGVSRERFGVRHCCRRAPCTPARLWHGVCDGSVTTV